MNKRIIVLSALVLVSGQIFATLTDALKAKSDLTSVTQAVDKLQSANLGDAIDLTKATSLLEKVPSFVNDLIKLTSDTEIKASVKTINDKVKELQQVAYDIAKLDHIVQLESGIVAFTKSVKYLIEIANNTNAIVVKMRSLTDKAASDIVGIFKDGKEVDALKQLLSSIKSLSESLPKALNDYEPKIIKFLGKVKDEIKKAKEAKK